MLTPQKCTQLADELEKMLPDSKPDPAKAAALGGIITKVTTLIAALRGGNVKAIWLAVRDVIDMLVGDTGTTIEFQKQAQAGGFDYSGLVALLLKLLPLILS